VCDAVDVSRGSKPQDDGVEICSAVFNLLLCFESGLLEPRNPFTHPFPIVDQGADERHMQTRTSRRRTAYADRVDAACCST